MMNKIVSVKNHVKKHRVGYAVAGTAAAFLLLMRHNTKDLNSFLKEHDLFDEYYYFED